MERHGQYAKTDHGRPDMLSVQMKIYSRLSQILKNINFDSGSSVRLSVYVMVINIYYLCNATRIPLIRLDKGYYCRKILYRKRGNIKMTIITREEVERLRQQYPAGTVVKLVRMDDSQAPPPGTKGIVRYVDDIGTIHVSWETGSSLGIVYGMDKIEKVR